MYNPTDEIRLSSPMRLLLIIIAATFAAELAIMWIISFMTPGSDWVKALIDSFLLVVLTFPVVYFFSFRPMARHIAKRQQAEAALQKTLDELERRIQERTKNLEQTNRELQLETNERRRAEEALQRSESRLSSILENAAEAIVTIDEAQNIILFNREAERIFQYRADEVLGQPLDILVPQKFGEAIHRHVQGFASWPNSGHAGLVREVSGRRKDGSEFPASIGISQHAENGRKIFTAILMDITEQKKAEAALRDSEARYRGLFDRIPAALYRTSPQGQILDANPALVKMLGYPDREAMMQVNVNDFYVNPADRVEENRLLEREGVVRGVQFRLKAYDGHSLWVQDSTRIVRDEAGNVLFYEGSLEDITERVLAEKQVQANALRSKALVNLSQELVEVGLDDQAIMDVATRHLATLTGDFYAIALRADDNRFQIASHSHAQAGSLYPVPPDSFEALLEIMNSQFGPPSTGSRADTNQPLLVGKLPGGNRPATGEPTGNSLLIVPLRAQERLIGTLSLSRDLGGKPFESDEQVFLQEIGGRVALAVANAQLFKKAQRSLDKVQALRQIDMAITSSTDLQFSLGTILDQVILQLEVDAVAILILNNETLLLDYAAGKGFRTKALQHTHLRIGEGYAGRAVQERRMISINDLTKRKTDFLRSPYFSAESFVSYFCVPLIAKGQVKGVMEVFHRSPLQSSVEWLDFLNTIATQAAIAVDNTTLFMDLQYSNQNLMMAYDATIEGWSHALDLRDKETEGHTQRVTRMTLQLAREIGLRERELVHVRRGALLHDIGKMGIPDHILLKEGPLSDEEWVEMRKHPVYAYELLKPIAYLQPALDIPYCHHEKWDGTGYPRGLKGEAIPLAARIFAVVDVWDALNSDRPYRPAWPREKVLDYIRSLSGSHFDPEVVQVFLGIAEGPDYRGE
ncbi:MAG: PAS domain S-box protein [Chloroflexota bacterium]